MHWSYCSLALNHQYIGHKVHTRNWKKKGGWEPNRFWKMKSCVENKVTKCWFLCQCKPWVSIGLISVMALCPTNSSDKPLPEFDKKLWRQGAQPLEKCWNFNPLLEKCWNLDWALKAVQNPGKVLENDIFPWIEFRSSLSPKILLWFIKFLIMCSVIFLSMLHLE